MVGSSFPSKLFYMQSYQLKLATKHAMSHQQSMFQFQRNKFFFSKTCLQLSALSIFESWRFKNKWITFSLFLNGALQIFLVGARWPHGQCGHLWIEGSGFEHRPGTLCRVLGQDTLLSQHLSPPRSIIEYRQIQCWGQFCDGF